MGFQRQRCRRRVLDLAILGLLSQSKFGVSCDPESVNTAKCQVEHPSSVES